MKHLCMILLTVLMGYSLSASEPIYVVKIDQLFIYLDKSITQGQKVDIYRKMKPTVHPKTGKKVELDRYIGSARIAKQERNYSLISKNTLSGVQAGDFIFPSSRKEVDYLNQQVSPLAAKNILQLGTRYYRLDSERNYNLNQLSYTRLMKSTYPDLHLYSIGASLFYGLADDRRQFCNQADCNQTSFNGNVLQGMVEVAFQFPQFMLIYGGLGGGLTDREGMAYNYKLGLRMGDFNNFYIDAHHQRLSDFSSRTALQLYFPLVYRLSGIVEFGQDTVLSRSTLEGQSGSLEDAKSNGFFMVGFDYNLSRVLNLTARAGVSGRSTSRLGAMAEFGLKYYY